MRGTMNFLLGVALLTTSCISSDTTPQSDPGSNLGGSGGQTGDASTEDGSAGSGGSDTLPDHFNSDLTYGSMTDQEGNGYATIMIGGQEWMAENLRTTIYRNGDPIPNPVTNAEWRSAGNAPQGAWSYMENNSALDGIYGKLYNWYAVTDARHLCPSGWHVPTDAEFTTLTDHLGGLSESGGKMKTTGTQNWKSPNVNATNDSGFSGLPGGYRNFNGEYVSFNIYGYWWTATYNDSGYAWGRFLSHNNGLTGRNGSLEENGLSVRCVRD